MNNETSKLIEQLAKKLGTTTEYLWGILLRQAPIAATITLIEVVLVMLAGVAMYKLNKHFSNEDNKVSYYNCSEAIGIPMVVAFIIWVILAIASFFSIGDIINGYFNPEFWALDYILSAVKSE